MPCLSWCSSRLTLHESEKQSLRRLFVATIDEQEGMGNHLTEQVTFAQFVHLLETRIKSGKLNIQEMSKIDWSKDSPARAWLVDQRLNPFLATAAAILLKNGSLKEVVQGLAQENGANPIDVVKQIDQISFRTLEGWSLLTGQNLGFTFGDTGKVTTQVKAKAFQLNEQGQPLDYDIGLKNLKAHFAQLRVDVEKVSQQKDPHVGQRLRGYLTSYAPLFISTIDLLETFDMAILDLQGVLDSIRFKMTLNHVDTVREAEALKNLLDQAVEWRERVIVLGEAVESSLQQQMPNGRVAVYNAASPWLEQAENLRRRIKHFCGQSVEAMDTILGFDGDLDLSMRFDSPWELAFVSDKAQAKGEGLEEQWTQIRTFQIIKEERYYTARWTELVHHPAVKDSKGNTIRAAYTQRVTRTSSRNETDHLTIETPPYEMQIQARIEELSNQIGVFSKQQGNQGQIQSLFAQIRDLKNEYAVYRQQPPTGKDESTEKIKRMNNQLAQVSALETQLNIADVRSVAGVAIFNRDLMVDSDLASKIAANLRRLDSRRHNVTKTALGLATAAGVGYGCWQWLMPPGAGL